MKILICEDDPTSLMLYKKVISVLRPGAEIFTATNGLIGLEIFRQEMDIDLVVTDNEMPELFGWEMIYCIKRLKLGVKNICITSNPCERVYDQFDAVLQKPVDITELRKLLETYLKDLQ